MSAAELAREICQQLGLIGQVWAIRVVENILRGTGKFI